MNGFVFLGFKNLSVECHQIYVDYDMALTAVFRQSAPTPFVCLELALQEFNVVGCESLDNGIQIFRR
jgi:hypothetical protein